MKKTLLALLLVIALCIPTLVACGEKVEVGTETEYAVAHRVYSVCTLNGNYEKYDFQYADISENGLVLSYGVCGMVPATAGNENFTSAPVSLKKLYDFKYDENGTLLAVIDGSTRYEVDKYDDGKAVTAKAPDAKNTTTSNDDGVWSFAYSAEHETFAFTPANGLSGGFGSVRLDKYGKSFNNKSDTVSIMTYDADGYTLLSATMADGKKYDYTYNENGYCTLAATEENEYSFTYDNNNRVTGFTEHKVNGTNKTLVASYNVTYNEHDQIKEIVKSNKK